MAFMTAEESAVSDLPFEEQVDRAFSKIIRCVNVREQSTVKMREKLARAGFSYQASEMALERAVRISMIDDARYAECLIRSALSQGKGLHFVLKEIESLEVDLDELDAYQEYLEEHSDTMIDRALEHLRRHRTSSKNVQAACFRKLMARGYGTRVATEAAALYCEELKEQGDRR